MPENTFAFVKPSDKSTWGKYLHVLFLSYVNYKSSRVLETRFTICIKTLENWTVIGQQADMTVIPESEKSPPKLEVHINIALTFCLGIFFNPCIRKEKPK